MAHEVERMFSARIVPWHYEMTQDRTLVTPDRLTIEQAIPSSGLDWEVERVPIYVRGPQVGAFPVSFNHQEVPGMIGLRRSTDHKILGIHTEGYVENQPREMFEWGWDIVEASMTEGAQSAAVWETGGSLAGGKKIFAMIKMPETVTISGDQHVPYLGLADSYDGSLARRAWMTFVRVVCSNTLDWSWSGAITKISIRHTLNSEARIAAARETLGISYSNLDTFTREVEEMMNQEVTDSQFRLLVRDLFPVPKDATQKQTTNTYRRRSTVFKVYDTSRTIGQYRGTAWGVLNAVQEWEQWSARGATSAKTPTDVANGQLKRMVTGTWPTTNRAAKQLIAARS